jgi:hypothetical protein
MPSTYAVHHCRAGILAFSGCQIVIIALYLSDNGNKDKTFALVMLTFFSCVIKSFIFSLMYRESGNYFARLTFQLSIYLVVIVTILSISTELVDNDSIIVSTFANLIITPYFTLLIPLRETPLPVYTNQSHYVTTPSYIQIDGVQDIVATEDQETCRVCFRNIPIVTAFPCGDKALCAECTRKYEEHKIDRCCQCNKDVTAFINLTMYGK